MFRVGIGQDTHRLSPGLKLVLGGVHIEAPFGAVGHSDADALSHSIADALLGAMAEGDIGLHFPDKDPQWKNANSLQLLARVMWLVRERNLQVVNVDSTISLEEPRLRPYIQMIRDNLALAIGTDVSNVSVKAKTGEGLDSVGRGEAIAVHTIVLLEQAKSI
jgi:2-C-methyl-D-erythritol 2,4-cyclodiphosphate synthase